MEKIAGLDNSLAVLHPALAKEWHQDKNGTLTPDDVRPGAGRKVWWQCEKGHEWQAAIYSRNMERKGCPHCSGKRASIDNNLKAIYPSLAAQWHYDKNYPLTPEQITPRSSSVFGGSVIADTNGNLLFKAE